MAQGAGSTLSRDIRFIAVSYTHLDVYKRQTYEFVEKELKKISNREKREEYLRFIAPCAGKSPAFIKAYLQNAKWKARSEHDGCLLYTSIISLPQELFARLFGRVCLNKLFPANFVLTKGCLSLILRGGSR